MQLRLHSLAILFWLAMLAFPVSALAADSPRQLRAAKVGGLDYAVFEVGGANADEELPMIVGLHYSGGTPEETAGYFDSLGFPARIVLPRGPYPRPKGHSWLPKQNGSPDLAAQAIELAATSDRLALLVTTLRHTYPTRGKPLVVGVSYGGDLAFLLALRHPDLFAAVFPVAARVLPEWMPAANPCSIGCPSIHALHGSADATAPMAPTLKSVEHLATLGFDIRITIYPGVAHDFNAMMQRDVADIIARYTASNLSANHSKNSTH